MKKKEGQKRTVDQPQAHPFVILVPFVPFIAPEPARFRALSPRKYLIVRESAPKCALFKKNLFPLKQWHGVSPVRSGRLPVFGFFWRFLGFFGSQKLRDTASHV
jgi:hypothetical protein